MTNHTHTDTLTDLALVQSTQSGHLLLEVVDAALLGQLELVLHQGRERGIKHGVCTQGLDAVIKQCKAIVELLLFLKRFLE